MKIMSLKVRFLILAFFVVSLQAYSAVSIDLGDGVALRLGGDIRLRYEGYTQSVLTPDADKAGRHATKYLRNRTRLWGSLDFGPDVTVNLRLGNRIHRVFSSPNPKS